ncbi:MAG: sigma-54-dependent Fis family transcriptional regulator [Acidobacteria bacterium SCN 69-37]|nr:MAG: sigma-54-dependent Fis family transcriptional regulator [Acidobacteria bacterium SCN 69-37]
MRESELSDAAAAAGLGDARELAALTDVCQAVAGTLTLRSALVRVLEILGRPLQLVRGAVVLINPSGHLHVEATYGVPADRAGARYGLAEGVTARVVESNRPVIVPQVSREPMFRDRLPRSEFDTREVSFVCVPIPIHRKAIGAIALDLPFTRDCDYDHLVRLLRLVALMLGQAVRVERLLDAERQRLIDENTLLREELRERYDFSRIIGTSGPMRQVYEQIARVARANTTVLIRGESGTGKELIAHAIHYSSPRAKKPFVKVSCAALPDSLIESELFGYEKGAFTGAQARKKGRFELAEGGTLFLDEIGEINLSTQVKLLRVLQEREFERLGGTETVKTNVRLIAATNADLETAIAAGTFRADLHYRLDVFTIHVPPLRDRKPDILLLADHFLEKYSLDHGHQVKRVSTPAIDMLMAYHWPGNVRELENAIERAVLVCDGSVVHPHHLPPTLQTAEASGTIADVSLSDAVDAYEKSLIQDALKTARGNASKAAKLLHSTERIISYKVRKLGIDRERFR